MSGSLKKLLSIDIKSEHAYVQFVEDSKWLLVATNDREKPLQMYNYSGQFVGSLGKGEVVANSTVAYDPTRGWVVTNKGNNVTMLDKEGRVADSDCIFSYDVLSGISFHPATGLLLLTDIDLHCVLGYDPRSKRVVKTIGAGYGRHPENFNCPTLVCSDKFGGSSLLCVSDRKNNQAKLFNIDGQLVEVFGSRQGGGGEGDLSHPLGVCMDARRRVLVCDQLNKRVVRFSSPQAGNKQYETTSSELRKFMSTYQDLPAAKKQVIPEEVGPSGDLPTDLSDADSVDLFERCPASASEYGVRKEQSGQSEVGSDEGGHTGEDVHYDCLLPPAALAARVNELGTFGTRYTSSVDLSSTGMLALSVYEDCDEQYSIVNLYTDYN